MQAIAFTAPSNSFYVVNNQESGTISRKLFDGKGEPLPGATIIFKEFNNVLISAANDTFSASVPIGTYNVSVTYVSFKPNVK